MGYTWSIFTQTAILCILLALPELGWCSCSLGGNNTGDVARRNNTILYYMNSTAMSFTSNSDRKISNHSSFQLWNYIQKTFSVTSKNYLVEAVSLGLLVKHDWLSATRWYTTNWTDQRTLEAYIRSEFLDPMHNRLQERAVYYSFSLGIFRPQQEQYNYTGVNASIILLNWENDGTRSPLQLNCVAGSRYLWRLSTSMEYDTNFDDRRTARFARSVNMIENSVGFLNFNTSLIVQLKVTAQFDQYYRKHEILGPDFVRVNVLNATNASNYVVMFMEAYFANSTYTAEQIMNLTDMSQVPKMYFSNGTTKSIPVTLRDAKHTYIATATIVVIPTTTGTTTGSTTGSTSANTEMASTTAVNESTSTTVVQTTSTGALTTTTTLVPTTTSTTTASVTLVVKNTEGNTTTANVSPSVVTESSTSSSTPTSSTFPPVTNTSDTTIVATTAFNNSDSSNSSTLAQSTEFVSQITSIVSESNLTVLSGVSTSTPSAGSNGQGNNESATTSNPNSQKANITTSDGLNTTGNGNAFGNLSSAGPGYGNGSATTFDPDPLFLASVPVMKKVYNDEVLLAKISKMLSITSKVAFTTITIPVALVTILFVICCLLCWQIDCCPASKKE